MRSYLFLFVILLSFIFSCSKSDELDEKINENKVKDIVVKQEDINKVIDVLFDQRFDVDYNVVKTEFSKYIDNFVFLDNKIKTRSSSFEVITYDYYNNVSDEVKKVLDRIIFADPCKFDTEESYLSYLKEIADESKQFLSLEEYSVINLALNTSSYVMDVYSDKALKIKTRSWWTDWGKCASSIVANALITGVTCAAAGAVAGAAIGAPVAVIGSLPAGGVGAIVGGAVGIIGGALKGAVEAC